MTERRDHEKLHKALQPFSRALAIHDALPSGFRPSDETPLRECLAGNWPTVADLRALVEWGSANPSLQSNAPALTEAQQQAQMALDKVMNCRFSNFDAGAVVHWAELGLYQVKTAPSPQSNAMSPHAFEPTAGDGCAVCGRGPNYMAHQPAGAQHVPCPCTLIEQDEDCPVGYPSMICGICEGKGHTTPEKVTALACEMIKIAGDLGEPEDPFATWESIDLINRQHEQMRKALQPFAKLASVMKEQEHRLFLQLLVCPAGDMHPKDYGRHLEAARAAFAATEGSSE